MTGSASLLLDRSWPLSGTLARGLLSSGLLLGRRSTLRTGKRAVCGAAVSGVWRRHPTVWAVWATGCVLARRVRRRAACLLPGGDWCVVPCLRPQMPRRGDGARRRRTPRRAPWPRGASCLFKANHIEFFDQSKSIDFFRGLFCRGCLMRQLAACGSESGGEQWKGIEHFCGSINYGTNRTILLLEFVKRPQKCPENF